MVKPGDAGIWFWYGGKKWEATPHNVTDTRRCTKLGDISTIEHLMSALAGLEISDAEIEVTTPDLPALDGAAAEFVRGLREAGIEELGERELVDPFARLFVHEEGVKIAIGLGEGHWRSAFLAEDRWPYSQAYETTDVIGDFAEQVAPARTFAFEEEVEQLRASGLGQGLSLETALVLGQDGYHNTPLFSDEPARHKMLDLIGDLHLSGVPARCINVVAERNGHRVNVQAARLLYEAARPEQFAPTA
jgi:UDP-3-O-[3-hydroxymyristoyl] N-acetylglucosamine deacetylase